MANVYHGLQILFGVGTSSGIGITGSLQTRDHAIQSDNEIVRDGVGTQIAKTYYGQYQTATFEYVASASGSGGTLTPGLPTQGTMGTVTDATYTAVAGSNWLVEKVSTKGSNTTALRVTLELTAYPSITS